MNNRGKWRGLTRLWICVASTSVLLSGCWDRREVNDIAFIIAMSVDKEEDGKYRLGVQVPLVGSMGAFSGGGGGTSGTKNYYVDSAVGKTLREAQAILQSRMARIHYFAHYRVVVIGGGLAKSGISKPFDIITRFPENRLTSFVVMTEGKGIELLEAQPQLERFSGEALRELVKAFTIPVSIKDVAQMISTPGIDMFVPVFKPADTQPKGNRKEVEAMGLAAFRGDKLVKVYKRSDAAGIRWFQRYFTPLSLVVPIEKGWISAEFLKGHASVKPVMKQGRIHFDIHLYSSVFMPENMSQLDFNNYKAINELEKRLSEEVTNKVTFILNESKKHRMDPTGLGAAFAKRYPKLWENKYKKNWRKELSHITFRIHSKVEVTNIGQITNSLMKEGQ